jgi:hypothetical protein
MRWEKFFGEDVNNNKLLLFCSGGYNIKTGPGCSIELMKFDMGGSAAVFGAAKALAQIKPPGVEVLRFSVTYMSDIFAVAHLLNDFHLCRFILLLLPVKI